jgi:signal transduction histidine kinase/DNA-binding response OmpR family regulator
MAEPTEPFGRPESLPPQQGVNILLVDDQPANLLALEAILQDLGHKLVTARSGQEALQRLAGGEFALVLLDVRMPGLDGLETATLIRGWEASRRTPIIFVTAFESDGAQVERAYALGAVDYLVKPLVPDIVRAKVAGLVELFERTQEVRRQAERIRRMEQREFEQALAQENARLRHSEQRLAAELAAMRRLHELTARLLTAPDLRTALDEVLDAALTMHGADLGSVQLYDPQAQALALVAQRGFRQDFLDRFRAVRTEDDTACGRALRTGGRVVIEDVEADPAYAPYRRAAAAAGYRAVQSTPLLSRRGELLGVLSTHFRRPHRPSERDLRLLDLYARQAADFIERLRAEEALQEADRRKDEWLAMLAHELRNPLAPIHNAVQFLRWKGAPDPNLQNARDIIERQLRQMARLVDDLLDVSRIGRGKLTLQKGPVQLAEVVAGAVESSRPLIEAAGHDLAVALPPEPILLEADPTRLAQVFLNLLNNAAKYTPHGGRIRLTAQRQGG